MPMNPNAVAIKALEAKIAQRDKRIAVIEAEKAGLRKLIEAIQADEAATR